MHFAVEVIRQPPVVIQSTQVRTANITHLQLLVSARARSVGKRAELAFLFFFGSFGGADFIELGDSGGDRT